MPLTFKATDFNHPPFSGPTSYAEALQFTVNANDTKDRNETKIGGTMLQQAGEKINDIVTGNNES